MNRQLLNNRYKIIMPLLLKKPILLMIALLKFNKFKKIKSKLI